MSVRTSTKCFFDFKEIWYVDMHDGMQYDLIQGQGHDPRALENGKFNHFQRLSPPPFIMRLANEHGFLN